MAVGRDVGLRAAGWTFAISNDWVDGEAFHRYDIDPEHHVYRDRIAAQCEESARVQFEVL